jgi:hypothetical protein
MKKLILSLGCLCLLALGNSLAMADDSTPAEGPLPRLGVEGGIDLANFNGQNVNDVFGSRLGLVGGAFLDVPVGAVLYLQPEILYAQKGGKYNGNAYTLNYVEVPILLDIAFIGPLGLLVGPAFDLNTTNNSGISNVNNTDIGLVLGGQLNLDRFLVSCRYEVGLSNISSNNAVQNGTFTALVGLSFI